MKTTSVKTNPFTLLDDLFQGGLSSAYKQSVRSVYPPVNIIETESQYILEVVAAGFAKQELGLKIDQHVLVLTGQKDSNNDTSYLRKEYEAKSFERRFTLPKTVELTTVKAEHKNRILVVCISKLPEVILKEEVKIDIL